MKRSIKKYTRARREAFITWGATGIFAHAHSPEYRYRRSDGTVAVIPAYGDTFFSPPFIGLLGGGVQRTVSPHFAVRFDAQAVMALVMPVGVRASASVSIPFGRYSNHSAERIEMRR